MSNPYDLILSGEEDRLRRDAAQANPYDAALDEQIGRRVGSAVRQATTQNPDKLAGQVALSRAAETPLAVVQRNEEEVEQRLRAAQLRDAVALSPILRMQVTDPTFAALAQDDAPTLARIEKLAGRPDRAVTSREFSRLVRQTMERNPILGADEARAMVAARVTVDNSPGGIQASEAPPATLSTLAAGVRSALTEGLIEQTRQGVRRFAGDMLGFEGMASDAQRLNRQSLNRQALATPRPDGLSGDVYAGVLSTVQSAPGIAAALINPAIGLSMFGVQSGASAYSKYRDRNATVGEASLGAVLEGGAEVLGVLLPMSYFVRQFGRVGAGQFITGMLAREIPTEMATTIAQTATDTAIANPNKTWGQWIAELPGELRQTGIATLVQSALLGGAGTVVRRYGLRAEEAGRAERSAGALTEFMQLAEAAKLRARDQQSFEQFVQRAADDGQVQEVFVSAQALMQSGVDPVALAQQIPAVQEQLPELQAGGDLVIPIEQLTRLAGTDTGTALLPHLRTDADSMSQAEAQAFYQSAAPELRAQVDRALADEGAAEQAQQQADVVRQHVMQQLQAAGRWTGDVNEAYTAGAVAFYRMMAARAGMTVEDMLQRYPLRVVSQMPAADALQQGDQDAGSEAAPAEAMAADQPGEVAQQDFTQRRDVLNQAERPGFSPPSEETRKALRIPPAWTDVVVSDDPNASLLAIGKDKKGRTQYLYSAAHSSAALREKFERLRKFNDARPALMDRIVLDAANGVEAASVLRLIAYTGFRVGGRSDGLADKEAFGASTLKPEHVRVEGSVVYFDFPGKKGVRQRHSIDDAALAEDIGRRMGNEQLFSASDAAVRNYLHGLPGGQEFKVHDFRTWAATNSAILAMQGEQVPKNAAEYWALRDRVGDAAAVKIGDTRTVALESYVDPNIFAEWQAAAGVREGDARPKRTRKAGRTDAADDGVLRDASDRDESESAVLAQRAQDGARGAFDPATNTIALLANADLSTFLHESAHFYLEVLADLAAQPNAPQQIRDDMQRMLDWFGVPDLAAWQAMTLEQKREHHEKFARGFEAYLFEGKSPSVELQPVFRRFSAWLKRVYQSLTSLGVELTDEVRGVFDRMLASDQQIAEAEAVRGMAPLFESAEQAAKFGVTPEQYAAYQEQVVENSLEAGERLQARSLRDMKWLRAARSRALRALQREAADRRKAVLAEVQKELQQVPVYAAQQFLRYGIMPDGSRVVGAKLDLDALREMYGDAPAAPWRYLSTGRSGLAGTQGLHPDAVADMFGFRSGDELVRAILAAVPMNQAAEQMTDQRMLERYGDLVDQVEIERAADDAVAHQARIRFIAAEFAAVARATGQPAILERAARELARQVIAGKRISALRPGQYLSAEARAGKAAQDAMRRDDVALAAAEKRNQLFNLQAFRAARDAMGEIERGVAYLRKFGRDGIRKSLDGAYVDQIEQLLERYDLRQISDRQAARRASLAEWVESQRELGIEPNIPPELLSEANRKPYRTMTVEEFRGLIDTIKQIEHLGRLKHRLLKARDQRSFEAIRDEIAASIDANASGKVTLRQQRGTLNAIREGVKRMLAAHRKFASIGRELDGFEDAGPFWQHIIRAMNEAGDMESSMREQATVRLAALFKPIFAGGRIGGRGEFMDAVGAYLNREERLVVALNAGNESNLQRLIGGSSEDLAWTPARVQAVIDSLSKEEMDFVQGVWDLFESFRPQIAEKERRVVGVEPKWIEPTPVVTRHGTYRGGYFPIKYDPRQSQQAEQHADAEAARQMLGGAYTSATTRRSFTKARVDEVHGRPLRLSFDAIFEGLSEVVHDLSWHEWLIDTNRLLRSDAINQAIRSRYGPETAAAIKDAVRDIAAGDTPAQNVMERALNHIRQGATIAGLGWNVSTALLQPIGLTQSMVRIGPKWVARGLADWLGRPSKMNDVVESIYARSEFMRLRGKTLNREINEIRNRIDSRTSLLESSYFILIQKLQLVADVPTWLGAYHKAIDAGRDEATAVALADQSVVDAQGGGQIKDLAQVQRGSPAWKLFTNFYSFFSTTYNLAVERTKATDFKSPAEVASLAGDYLLLFIVPATLGALLKAALKGEVDDEDELLKKLAAENISYLLGTMVLLRELAPAVQKAAGVSEFNIAYGGPAGLRLFQAVDRFGQQAGQGDIDAAFLRSLNSAAGVLFHYPSGQVQRTVEGAVDMMDGRTSNPLSLVLGPPRE